jgi:hypothetical protein
MATAWKGLSREETQGLHRTDHAKVRRAVEHAFLLKLTCVSPLSYLVCTLSKL